MLMEPEDWDKFVKDKLDSIVLANTTDFLESFLRDTAVKTGRPHSLDIELKFSASNGAIIELELKGVSMNFVDDFGWISTKITTDAFMTKITTKSITGILSRKKETNTIIPRSLRDELIERDRIKEREDEGREERSKLPFT